MNKNTREVVGTCLIVKKSIFKINKSQRQLHEYLILDDTGKALAIMSDDGNEVITRFVAGNEKDYTFLDSPSCRNKTCERAFNEVLISLSSKYPYHKKPKGFPYTTKIKYH